MINKRILLPLMLFLLPLPAAFAEPYNDSDPNDYITERFDVRAVANSDHSIDISETISVDFIQQHHGIERYIPIASDNTYIIKDLKVDGYKYSTKKEDGYEIIRAGEANKYLTGQHTYNVTYTLQFFADYDESADHLAYNILPTGWATSVREASLSLTMPSPIDWSQFEIYGGLYGSTDNKWREYFSYNIDEAANTIYIEGHDIPKHFGLTLRDIQLPDSYWQNAVPFELPLGILAPIFAALAPLAAIGSIFSWFKHGRSPHIVKPVEFYPPDNLTPAEIGYALDEEVDNDEMMSMVLYFANKGYLRIHEYHKKKYEFIKVKDIDDSEPGFAKHLFNGLFSELDIVTANSIPSSFYKKLTKAEEMLAKSYTKERGSVISTDAYRTRSLICFVMILIAFLCPFVSYYRVRDLSTGTILGGLCAGIMLVSTILCCSAAQHKRIFKMLLGILGYLLSLGMIFIGMLRQFSPPIIAAALIGEAVMLIFAMLSKGRTKENAELVGKILGFKEFIRTAEVDRLKMLINSDPQYCYAMLPYAAVLGLDGAWAKKLTRINVPKPYWYDPYESGTFVYSPSWCHSMTRSCIHDSIPLNPDRSSGGSSYSGGSSGGGFSGGGGGGGGGGAW